METDQDPPKYDSDDSLPDVEELCSSQPTEIKEGDIVWAKYRQFHWPSLIRKVFKKEKKVSLWYLDSPKKCFKVSMKNIHSFKDRSFCQEVRKAVSESPLKVLHEKVLDSTLCYLQRRGQGIKDDPGAYFDRSMHYLSLFDLKSSTLKEDDPQAQLTRKCLQSSLNENYNNDNDKDSEEESIIESEDEEEKYDRFSDELEIKEEEYCPEDKVDAIVACITSGKINKYLLDVTAHKVPSERQRIFDEYMKTRNPDLLLRGSHGIFIKDFNKLREICNYLQNFYESVVEKGKWNMFRYVTSVWLPDALTKANSLVEAASDGTTEELGAKRKLFSSVEDEPRDNIKETNSPTKSKKESPKKLKQDSPEKRRTSPRKPIKDSAVLAENCVTPVRKSRSPVKNGASIKNESPKIAKKDNSENSTAPKRKPILKKSPKRKSPLKKTTKKPSVKKLHSNDSAANNSETVSPTSKKNPKSRRKNSKDGTASGKNVLQSHFVEGSGLKLVISNGTPSKNITVSKTLPNPNEIVNGREMRARPPVSYSYLKR